MDIHGPIAHQCIHIKKWSHLAGLSPLRFYSIWNFKGLTEKHRKTFGWFHVGAQTVFDVFSFFCGLLIALKCALLWPQLGGSTSDSRDDRRAEGFGVGWPCASCGTCEVVGSGDSVAATNIVLPWRNWSLWCSHYAHAWCNCASCASKKMGISASNIGDSTVLPAMAMFNNRSRNLNVYNDNDRLIYGQLLFTDCSSWLTMLYDLLVISWELLRMTQYSWTNKIH